MINRHLERQAFDVPDEVHIFPGGRVEVVRIAGMEVGRGVFEPGWRWSASLGRPAGTDTCLFAHVGCVLSGRLRVLMDDGEIDEYGSGEVFAVPPGHDAEVVGDEPAVVLDFTGVGSFAVSRATPA